MTINDLHINMDSFSSECPQNWEDIAEHLNHLIDAVVTPDEFGTINADDRDEVNAIWERYCAGQIDGAPAPTFS